MKKIQKGDYVVATKNTAWDKVQMYVIEVSNSGLIIVMHPTFGRGAFSTDELELVEFSKIHQGTALAIKILRNTISELENQISALENTLFH